VKPCSAYCRPEEGVHVHIGYASKGALPMVLADAGRTALVEDRSGTVCIPDGTRVRVLHTEVAKEAPVPPKWDGRTAVLYTVQVLK